MEDQEKKPSKLQILFAKVLSKYFGLLLLAMVFLVFVFSYFLLLKPKFDSAVANIRNSSVDKEERYALAKKKFDDLKALASSYSQIDPRTREKVDQFLPSEYIQEQLFLELEEVIIKNGFTVDSITIQKELNPASTLPATGIGRVKVDLAVSSVDYRGFKSLLMIMENNVRLMDVYSLEFDPAGSTAKIEFYTYFLKN